MTGDAQPFDQDRYWIERHVRLQGDPRATGNVARSIEENRAGDAILCSALADALRLAGRFDRVLEIGCGTGRVAPVFIAAGIDYAGLDVSPVAIEAARAQVPGATFLTGSALALDWGPPRDLVAGIYVFAHFVDDGDWHRLIGRIGAFLPPGGALLVVDDMPTEQDRPAPHVVRRPRAAYCGALEAAGLQVDEGFVRRLAVSPAYGMADRMLLARRPAGDGAGP